MQHFMMTPQRLTRRQCLFTNYAANAHFVPQLGRPLIPLLGTPTALLDVGCGDGTLTRDIARALPNCKIMGIDPSESQIIAARQNQHMHNVQYLLANVESLDQWNQAQFDCCISNAALHWVKDLKTALRGIAHVLQPDARLVVEMGGAGNIQIVRNALEKAFLNNEIDYTDREPWRFPDEKEMTQLLDQAGMQVLEMTRFNRPTQLSKDKTLADWLDTFSGPIFRDLKEEMIVELKSQACEIASSALLDDKGWILDYVRLRFVACKKDQSR